MSSQLDNELRELISRMPNLSMAGKIGFRELLWQQYENKNLTKADIVWMQTLVGLFSDTVMDYEDKLMKMQAQGIEIPDYINNYAATGD